MLDVVRLDRCVDVDLSLASAYLPLCLLFVKFGVVLVLLYGGAWAAVSRVVVAGSLFFSVSLDSVFTVERIFNTNAAMLCVVYFLIGTLFCTRECVVTSFCVVCYRILRYILHIL